MSKLADEIWAAIQRPSPAISKAEIEKTIVAHAMVAAERPYGSMITLEDVEDKVVQVPSDGWAFDNRSYCYRPIANMRNEAT